MLKSGKVNSNDTSNSKRRVKLWNKNKDSGTMANQGSFVRYSFMPPNSRDAAARNEENTLGELPITTPQSAGGMPAGDDKGIVKGRGRLLASDSGSVDTNRDASGK